jgi:hypothetical protein
VRVQIGGMGRHLDFGEMQRAAKRFVRRSRVPFRHERNVVDDIGWLRADSELRRLDVSSACDCARGDCAKRDRYGGGPQRSKYPIGTCSWNRRRQVGFSVDQLSVNNLDGRHQEVFQSFHAPYLSGGHCVASTASPASNP